MPISRACGSLVVGITALCALALAGPALAAPKPSVAALQVALRQRATTLAPIDGVDGPQTQAALRTLHLRSGIRGETTVGPRTRAALGLLGRPLLGQRELFAGVDGLGRRRRSSSSFVRSVCPCARWTVGSTSATAAALRRFQAARGIAPDGIAGKRTFRALVTLAQPSPPKPYTPPVRAVHVVRAGESFFSIGQTYRISPLLLAKENGLPSPR